MAETARERILDAEFLRKLERLMLVARRVHLGMAKGERRSKRRGSSVEFADYRDYVQGDDLRFVDWNIASRLDSLYLKLFEEQEDLTLHLLIDGSASMAFGQPPKLEFACKMAAALGYVALAGFDRVSAEVFCGDTAYRLPSMRGKASANRFFSFLEDARAEGATDLEASCKSYVLRNRAKGVALLISDFLDPEGFEGCLRRLGQSGSDLYVLHVLAREEVDPPVTGDLRLVDCETKAFTEISMSRALLKRYKENLAGFCEEVRRTCVSRNIVYVPAVSDMPYDRLTFDLLRRNGMLR
ncbi:MAG: DUF58 domain-containing protein [FCB group bacterium]|jgi:uncharacterized protein (DUF58 family)|nr:DUF58 domain-containing protein [FCB group bacterium]